VARRLAPRYIVVKLDHFDHVGGEMPLFGQDLAALTMGESEMLFFAAMQRHMSFAGGLDARG